MKKVLLIIFLMMITSGISEAKTQTIKCGINNNKVYIKTNVNGHNITLRTPKISKNKYLKLVNVAL